MNGAFFSELHRLQDRQKMKTGMISNDVCKGHMPKFLAKRFHWTGYVTSAEEMMIY